MRRLAMLLLGLVLLAPPAGCGGGDGVQVPENPAPMPQDDPQPAQSPAATDPG